MDIKKFKDNGLVSRTLDGVPFIVRQGNSAIENNKNDLVSNQGSSGITDNKMGNQISKIEKEYLIRSERFDRDEENPMYDAADDTWGAPDHF